jgi:hypothetical protein
MKLAVFFATIGCLYSIMIARESGEPLIGVCVGTIIFITGMYIYFFHKKD